VTVIAPPPQDELEALIREARARQRRRWLGAAAVIALLAGAALVISSIITGGSTAARRGSRESTSAVRSGKACGVHVINRRIVGADGRTLFREPGNWTSTYPHPSAVRCSGSTAWVVWDNGAAMNQEGYVGVRSGDDGRMWRLVFAEAYFGVNAPHQLDSYLGAWTLGGPQVAYFTGSCPVCGAGPLFGTVSLWVTKNGGRTFRRYAIPSLDGYSPSGIRVSGREVTVFAKQFARGARPRKTATVHVD